VNAFASLLPTAGAGHDTLFVKLTPPPGVLASPTSGTLGHLGGMALTIAGGVIVFVLTQSLARLAIEPAVEVRRVIGRIAHALVFYADIHSNPGQNTPAEHAEAKKAYRDLSSELHAAATSVPPWARRALATLKILPSWGGLTTAAKTLIGLSNNVSGGMGQTGVDNANRADMIRAALGVENFR